MQIIRIMQILRIAQIRLIQLPRREDRQNETIPAALHLIPPVYFRSLSILASLVDTIGRICLELLDRLNRRNLRKK